MFAAGDGVLVHLRDGRWEPLAFPSGAGITGIWATPSRVDVVGWFGEWQHFRDVTCAGAEQDCNDGWDNDCDGRPDAADPDCAGKVAELCANLADDDGDGKIDCADPDCASFPPCVPSPPRGGE